MSAAQPAQFTLPFTHYAKLGYSPCPTEGKVPAGGPGWYTQECDYAALDRSGYNVGLRCSNIVGLDIDVEGGTLAATVEARVRKSLGLPKATPRRIGKAPKRLLIARVNAPTKGFDIKAQVDGKSVTLFQLLGAGKQFVIHGTHPDTHKPYALDRPLPKWSKLPLVDDDALARLKADLIALFEGEGFNVRSTGSTGKKGSGKFSGPPWTEVGMTQAWDALDALDPDMTMDEWAAIGFAIHDGTHGSDEGLALWDAWSSKGDKYKPGDCARRWRGFAAGGAITRATLFKNNFPKVGAGSPHEPAVRVADAPAGDGGLGIDIGALLDFEAGEVPWVVQDVLTYGAHLLVGRPKGGKSWVTLDMAFACANAGTFLGKQARKTGVLWISGEDTRASLSRRLKVRKERATGVTIMTSEDLKAERVKWEECSFDSWLRTYLDEHPQVGLVIMDTHATIEAAWAHEAIDEKRNASIVAQAYQMSRLYEDIGQATETCIVLVHHAGKLKNQRNGIVDYHELINLPATVVAGATASLVLADPPDRDIHDEDDHRRVFAVRGRHIIGEAPLLIELRDGHAKLLGIYHEVVQSEAQAETITVLEALLAEMEPDAKGEKWVTLKQLAQHLGKHEKTVAGHFKAMKKDPKKMIWHGQWRVELKASKGVRLVAL